MAALLQLQKLPGKRDGGWGKNNSLRLFLADQKITSLWKLTNMRHFGASYSMSNKLLLVARLIRSTDLQEYL